MQDSKPLFVFIRTLLMGSVMALLAVACGGGTSNTPAKSATKDQGPAPELSIKLQVEATTEEAKAFLPGVTSALTSTFANAGYTLVEDEKTAQVQAKVLVGASEKPAVFQTTINGQRQVSYNVKVDASFMALGDSSLIDKTVAQFTADSGEVDAAAIENLVAQLGERGKLRRYAQRLEENKQAEAQRVKDEEDKIWQAANADDCRKSTSESACKGVDDYLAKYPSGRYAAEGRKAIEEGKGAAEDRREEDMWAKATVAKCKQPSKVEDCQGIQQYLEKYPNGKHAEEANGTLKSVAVQLQALQKRAEAEAAAENKQECIKECKRRFIDYSPGAFNILVSRCIQTDC